MEHGGLSGGRGLTQGDLEPRRKPPSHLEWDLRVSPIRDRGTFQPFKGKGLEKGLDKDHYSNGSG